MGKENTIFPSLLSFYGEAVTIGDNSYQAIVTLFNEQAQKEHNAEYDNPFSQNLSTLTAETYRVEISQENFLNNNLENSNETVIIRNENMKILGTMKTDVETYYLFCIGE